MLAYAMADKKLAYCYRPSAYAYGWLKILQIGRPPGYKTYFFP
jgi:hypothetical protein